MRNRILSPSHYTVMAHDGHVTDRLIAYQEARARGGAGLIVIQVSGVHETARYTSHILMATTDDAIPGYARLAEAVHRHGAKICGQLFHPGREIMETQDGTAAVAYAPSAVPSARFHVMPVPLSQSLKMLREIVSGYGDAAARLMKVGFDGCEIVASRGYLPAQFLNPHVNRREDAYGGSVENRLRFLREVAAGIRAKTGPDFVDGLRISGEEHDSQTLEPAEVLTFCKMLDGDGVIDYFSVAAGTSASLKGAVHIVPPMYYSGGYLAPFAAALKAIVGKPVFVAGRINQPQIAEQVLETGQADMCGMTRAMICDPDMPVKAREGRVDDIRTCIACNQACIGHFHKGYPISCIQHPENRARTDTCLRPAAARRKRVIVAGGGPAGMKAAAVLAERGHAVVLHEADAQLGGQARLAQLLPGRAEFGGIITNLEREMDLAGVTMQRRSPVTRALVEAAGVDAVVIATGGADGATVYMEHSASGEPMIFEGVDTLVLAQGHDRVAELEAELEGFPVEVYVIGDALTPRTAEEAVLEGLKAGLAI